MSQQQSIVFFVDRCLGNKTIPDTLRQLGISVECHNDHFPKAAQDTEWLPEVGKREWIVLTKDAKIGRSSLEKIAVASARIRMFVLVSQNLSGEDMAKIFQKAIVAMQAFARNNPAPFIAKIYKDGKVTAWKSS